MIKKNEIPIIDIDTKVEEKKPMTLPEQIRDMNEKLEQVLKLNKFKKDKPFKLKGRVRAGLKSTLKRSRVLVFILGTNRIIKPCIMDLRSGYIVLDGVPRMCTQDYFYLYDGKYPTIVIPEWSLEPIGIKEYYDKNPNGLPLAVAEKFIVGVVESNDVKAKAGMSRGAIVFIGLAILAGLYVLFGGGK